MKVIEFKGTKWYVYHNTLLPDLPPHEEPQITLEEAKALVNKTKAYFVSWTTDFDSSKPYPFWYIIKEEKEDLKNYKAKIRSEIKRGLKNCKVELLSRKEVEEYVEDLYKVYKLAFIRYKSVYTAISTFEEFRNNICNYNDDIWVAKNKNNEIIAYALMKTHKDKIGRKVVGFNVIKLNPEFLDLYPSYALVYEINRFYLNEKNFLYVHDGRRSIGHETKIHEWFIKKFKFRKAYCKLSIVYRSDISFLVKTLFLIRKNISKLETLNPQIKKISTLLKYEEIRRQCLEI